jgi:SAM-dependent methyltransferase
MQSAELIAEKDTVSYHPVSMFPGWEAAPEFLASVLAMHGSRQLLEIGSGANPTLSPEYVRQNGLRCVTSDIDARELEKADPAFTQLVVNLAEKNVDPTLYASFDCVFSRMVNEHINDGELYHRNIYKVLKPGGIAIHCFSTLWTFPFVVNRLLPEIVTSRLLKFFDRNDEYKHGKFRAHYSWSRGPSKTMLRRFQRIGYEVLRYAGYFGHNYYRRRAGWLQGFEDSKSRFLLRHPQPLLCSYAVVVLRRPLGGEDLSFETQVSSQFFQRLNTAKPAIAK